MIKLRIAAATGWLLTGAVLGGLVAHPAVADEAAPAVTGRVDWGYGPGVRPGSLQQRLRSAAEALTSAPLGGPDAHLAGAWGSPFTWPLVAIHTVLLPDGRVMSFGSSLNGQQVGAALYFSLWDPARGVGAESHTVLPNSTRTDIFCAAQTVLPATGEVGIFGGDAIVDGKRYNGNERLTLFRPDSNSITSSNPMFFKRWYATALTMPDGAVLVMGGRQTRQKSSGALTPEVRQLDGAWRLLTGATSNAAFGQGTRSNWWYPRGFLGAGGTVFVLGHDGPIFEVDPTGLGSIRQLAARLPVGHANLPSLLFAPHKALSLRMSRQAVIVNLEEAEPSWTRTASVPTMRYHSSGTVLADGTVLVTGGTTSGNTLEGARYEALIWSPASGTWRTAARAQKARLYHSSALLLPDATVLVAGGGAYGPVTNLNAEIYYPPYLFKADGSGELAPRPTIVSAPQTVGGEGVVPVEVGADDVIARVVAVRLGSSTHSFNADQRHLELTFAQDGTRLEVAVPADRRVALPGYYLLFVFDAAGVPSLGHTILVPVAAGV
jgi:hypothetical protein